MKINLCSDIRAISRAAAEHFVRACRGAQGPVSVALSGGNTPRRLYNYLSSSQFANKIEWDRVNLFFGDERYVPLTQSGSNYAMALKYLISNVPIPEENVHPVDTELSPALSAKGYEEDIRAYFERVKGRGATPAFDLILLGLGADCHTLSVFPGCRAVTESTSLVVSEEHPGAPVASTRITMTLKLVNLGLDVVFLASGADKADVVKKVLEDSEGSKIDCPAKAVSPAGSLTWFIDKDAASKLSRGFRKSNGI